jgi:iron complex outermembrane receptor protein
MKPCFLDRTPSRRRQLRSAASALGIGALICAVAPNEARAQPSGSPAPAPAEDVTPPTVKTHVDAVYPTSSLAEREHGDVVLALTVDVDGHVSKVDVLESGGAGFDEAAIVAARQWTFAPAKRAGRPIPSRIRVPFHFAPPAPPPELVPEKEGTEHALPPQAAALPGTRQTATPPAPGKGEAEEVYVTEQLSTPSRGVSDFNLRVGELARVPHRNATDYLKMSPGVFLANEGGEGHAEQIFVRGFDTGEGQDLEFSVGGVPINERGNLHGDGYADTHFIIPELVTSLRVIQGPFDPRQGNYAVAGSANYELGLERRGLTAKYTTGSFGTQRLLLTWGPKDESVRTFGGAEIASTDGFGQNRDALRGSAMGQYEGRLGKRGSYRLIGTAYSTQFQSAGVVRDDDYRAGRLGFYESYALAPFSRQAVPPGGSASRYSIAGDVQTRSGDTTFSQQVFLIKRDMRIIENFTGFLLDTAQSGAQRGDTFDIHMNELTLGARGSSSWSARALGQRQDLELGYFVRGDSVRGIQQRLTAASGEPYATDTNVESTLGDLGLYADTALRPVKWVTVRGGLRGRRTARRARRPPRSCRAPRSCSGRFGISRSI